MRPTPSLFNVFAVAAEEVNIAETIKKQLFSPDHQDDKPKRTVRERRELCVQRTLGVQEGESQLGKVLV